MKRQFIFVLTFISFFFCSNSVTAQVSPKKKAATTAVKKTTTTVKKSSAKLVKNTTASSTPANVAPIVNTPSGSNTCKVTKTAGGCSIIFEFNRNPNSELARKGDTYSKKEFRVSCLDNSITEVGKKDLSEGAQKVVKSEIAVLNDGMSADGNQVNVAIKDLMFVFDVLKDKKQLPITNNGCTLPSKVADGTYVMNVNWNWDMPTDKATRDYCVLKFKLEVKEGNFEIYN